VFTTEKILERVERRAKVAGLADVLAQLPEVDIGDGGIVPWTQRLLSNRKERLCIGGFGLELACRLWAHNDA
jgi:hypothetical protein